MISPYMESILMFAGINILLALSWYMPHCAGLISMGQGSGHDIKRIVHLLPGESEFVHSHRTAPVYEAALCP